MKPLPPSDLDEIGTRCASVFHALKSAHILITGATGFVGSWLTESGREAGLRVSAHARRREVVSYPSDGMFGLHADIRALVIPDGVTHVIHCASAASASENFTDATGVAAMIRDGTARVAAECARVGVSRLLHLSSGCVTQPNGNGFADAKAEAERLAQHPEVSTVIARGYAMIGPRLPQQFAAAQFLADATAHRTVRVHHPATMRSYLYAADLAAWLWWLLVNGRAGSVHEVGHPSAVSLGTLALLVAAEGNVRTEMGTGAAGLPFVPSAVGCPFERLTNLPDAIHRTMAWERSV